MPLPVKTLTNSAVVKEATKMLHADVENLLLPKLQAIQTRADYVAILKMFYGYFSPLEGRILTCIQSPQLPDIAERRKALAILEDIAACHDSVRGIPVCLQLPEVKSEAQAFGALYVLEGSTLGGKMIAKMLLKNKTLSVSESAVTFFSGYGEETGEKWKTFLAAFDQQENAGELVRSANETFYHLKRWMQHTFYHE